MDPQRLTSVLALGGEAKFAWREVDARLAGKVDAFWTLTVEKPDVVLRIIPDGRIDLIFDIGRREAFLTGPTERPFEVRHDRAKTLLGATMSPEFAAAALVVEPHTRIAGWAPLEATLGPFAGALIARVTTAEGEAAQAAALETFLLARAGAVDRRVAQAIARIRESGGRVAVADLGRASGASPRNLARLFYRWVGLPPKTFSRIARVQAALRRMQETPAPNLKALAAELGFADQAHLSREVKAMTGASPGRLAETFKERSEMLKLDGD